MNFDKFVIEKISLFQGKFVMSELVAKYVFERGIYLAAFMPIKITEPADRAKNIVGELRLQCSSLHFTRDKFVHNNSPPFLICVYRF